MVTLISFMSRPDTDDANSDNKPRDVAQFGKSKSSSKSTPNVSPPPAKGSSKK